ncbi:hypothetical protein [Roseburia sp. 499]|uniref:hypothetical protein n=1 Tax=Roseburia sp. 499 TaxID=1261634 RepID=UPI0009535E92|nr:hypothetical protein [Roseburia sp. 499]WVK69857.1 hypothetical protein BIV20_16195 [Roseburia sp. 499]
MRVQGSYTVEAAIIVPIVLGCMLLILNRTIELYIEVTETTVYSSWWQEFEPADSFRKVELLKRITGKNGEE